MANFLVTFRDKATGLPLASYDLWEEKIGVSTYTCASTYGGLMAAAKFSELLDKRNHMREYKQAAKEIKQAMTTHLFSESLQSFVRIGHYHRDGFVRDETVDSSSLFGLWYFGVFDQSDPLFEKTYQQTRERLWSKAEVGGFIRYERDDYFRSTNIPNPWFITTLWEAQMKLSRTDITEEDLLFAEQTFAWVASKVYSSGVLAEQLNPYTGASLSSTPLVWSHAVYIETVLLYMQKKRAFDIQKQEVPEVAHTL